MTPPIVRSDRRIVARLALLLLCTQVTVCVVLSLGIATQPAIIEYRHDDGYVVVARAFGIWSAVLAWLYPAALLLHKVRPVRYIGPLLMIVLVLQCYGLTQEARSIHVGATMPSGASILNESAIIERLGKHYQMRLDRTFLPFALVVITSFLSWLPLPKQGPYRRFLFEALPKRFRMSDALLAFVVVAAICAFFRYLWDVN